MADFLLELLSEEIPARMQARARNDLARMFAEELDKAGLEAGAIDVYSTPRRLALIARGLAGETAASREEIKGPKASAPAQALEGFLRKTGLKREQLEERDGVLFAVIDRPGRSAAEVIGEALVRIVGDFPWPKSMRWGDGTLRWVRPLHGIVALLGEEIVAVEVGGIASGASTVGHRFHHPGAITIGGAGDYLEKLRACHVIVDQDERERLIRDGAGQAAADAGLKLLPDEGLVVENAGLAEWPVPLLGQFDPNYLDVPREVIVLTMRTNQKYFACTDGDGALVPAFVCIANIDAKDGGTAIIEGNRRVLAARLADARFFWEQDLKVPLEERSGELDRIIYFEGLGTYAEKQHRLEFLCDNLMGLGLQKELWGITTLAAVSKADLATATVGEFPELQGIIGAYLAKLDERTAKHADALRGLYLNAHQIWNSPADKASNLLQLADRIDAIVSFAAVGVWFTGSRDPFAIRQSAQAAIAALLRSEFRISLNELIRIAYESLLHGFAMSRTLVAVETLKGRTGEIREIETPLFGAGLPDSAHRNLSEFPDHSFRAKSATELELHAAGFYDHAIRRIREFYTDEIPHIEAYRKVHSQVVGLLIDRLKVQQREAGVRHDLIDAVFALGGEDDLVRLLARVTALQAFVETDEGRDLLVAYKRAANILKRENWTAPEILSSPDEQGIPQTGEEDPLVLVDDPILKDAVAELASGSAGALEPHEQALVAALDAAEPKASKAVEAEDFAGAMAALASLRKPIDEFFDHVTVNDPDPAKRERRLNLLLRFRDAVHRVADFSRIEG